MIQDGNNTARPIRGIFYLSRSGDRRDRLGERPPLLQRAATSPPQQACRQSIVETEVQSSPQSDPQHRHIEPAINPPYALHRALINDG